MADTTTTALSTVLGVSRPMTYNHMGPGQGGSTSLKDIAICGRGHQGSALPFPSALMKSHLVTYPAPATESCSRSPPSCARDPLQRAHSMDELHCIGGVFTGRMLGTDLLLFPTSACNRVCTSRILPMTIGAVPDAQAGLCCLVFAPVNPLDKLGNYFWCRPYQHPITFFPCLCPCSRSYRPHFPSFAFHFLITFGSCCVFSEKKSCQRCQLFCQSIAV